MLKLTLTVSGSGEEIFIGEVPTFAEADAVVGSLEKRWKAVWDGYPEMVNDKAIAEAEEKYHQTLESMDYILRYFEGSDVTATDADGKIFLNTSEGEWEQI